MVIDAKNVTIKLRDGTSPTPHELSVKLGEGNITYSEKKPRQYIRDRGRLDTVRNADEEPVDVSVDAEWEFITTSGITGAAPSVEDFLKKRGAASGYASTSSDPCEPYAVDIEIIHDPECAQVPGETITIADFRYETADHDLKAGTLRFAGKANVVEATVVRDIVTTV